MCAKAKNGVVVATEKKLPALVDETTYQKIAEVTEHIGMVYAGMGPDSRVLVKRARKIAQQYFRSYGESIPVKELVRDVAAVMQEFTQSGGVRPFGVALLICGHDESGFHLYQVDPSGSFWAWKASAIGKGMLNAQSFLEKRYKESDELEDCINMAILTLKEAFEGEMDEKNIGARPVVVDVFALVSVFARVSLCVRAYVCFSNSAQRRQKSALLTTRQRSFEF